MSWANKYRALSAFRSNAFKKNAPVNENSLIWNMYRLSLTRMRSLQAHSTHWRATCNYPTHGVDFTDYVRGNFKDFNIVEYLNDGKPCRKVELVNIRGHMGIHLTARFWQSNSYLLHMDSSQPAAISTRRPAQCQVKITLVIMQPSTTSSVAQRGIFPPPSGGLVPICKARTKGSSKRQKTTLSTQALIL